MATAAIETPSGKGARDENFQVGSILIEGRLRPHVMAFYHFVRAADDIADDPVLEPDEKLARLARFDRALQDPVRREDDFEKAAALRASLAASGVTVEHPRDLLRAFMQDATKTRYVDWADLLGYCRLSASPVGRYLLDLHGESRELWQLSDPLCDALQVLNHVQDCQADYRRLGRVYLPEEAFARASNGPSALDGSRADPALRQVIDWTLDRTAGLLRRAEPLPAALRSRRLGAETAVVFGMARHLLAALRRRDPIAGRVELGRLAFLAAGAGGLGRMVWQRLRGFGPDPATAPMR
jgi:squalene synthase HpnC